VTTVGVFDVRSAARLVEATFPGDRLQWSPTGAVVAGAGYGPAVWVCHADTGGRVVTLELERKYVQDFAFSPDGAYLVAVSNEELVRIWDTRDWSERQAMAWGIGKLKCVTFAPDGQRAACGSDRGTILIWDWDL
jgi:WD40 repeat protein